jgi:hypothetical protein
MNFKEWFITEDKHVVFTTFAKDGTVIAVINGKRYEYMTDALYHNKWKRMIPYSPWRVLNIIKKLGTLVAIDGKPINHELKQGTLF